ncbi:hypothetical protein JI749_12340 [Devosia oryziradicis]|uniref:Uncharacterized protein n=1 Tax=Devosia oryziradicis TaxID=2801335 RepID=A0ABX7BUD0_9HYPH|nr:hypothetical protein [Devosia oryziradicis]QQR35158.1 hypothetical protein JI749_12340 [Devosia oryziradicis]
MPAPLSTRTIRAYRRLAKPLAALMKVTRSKAAGPVGPATVARCNAVIAAANAIFSRERDFGRLPSLPAQPLSALDLALVVDELTIAALRFEERYPELDSSAPSSMPR